MFHRQDRRDHLLSKIVYKHTVEKLSVSPFQISHNNLSWVTYVFAGSIVSVLLVLSSSAILSCLAGL
jgi:hypothetical protein